MFEYSPHRKIWPSKKGYFPLPAIINPDDECITPRDENNDAHGEWFLHHKNGWSRVHFNHGMQHGLCNTYSHEKVSKSSYYKKHIKEFGSGIKYYGAYCREI